MTSLCDKSSVYVKFSFLRLRDKFTVLLLPLIFGETIPTSRVQVPIPEAHLVAVDASGHSTSGPAPFLDAVLIAEELVILLEIAH